MNKNIEEIQKENEEILNSFHLNENSSKNKVFNTELLLNQISVFMTFEEIKIFFSINKKLNAIFRKNIYHIRTKKIITTPEIISRFPNLKSIKLSWGLSMNLDFLSKPFSQNLENIQLEGDKYQNIELIGNLEELKTLILTGNKIKNISFIKNLNKLSLLDLGHNRIKDLAPLANLSSLKSLSLQGCNVTNLNILKLQNFQKLEKLCIGQNNITDYSFLTNLVNFLLTIVNKFDILSIACGKEELVKKVFKKN